MTIQNLYDRLHTAREHQNRDAITAYSEAIRQANRGNEQASDWWRLQGDYVSGRKDTPQVSLQAFLSVV